MYPRLFVKAKKPNSAHNVRATITKIYKPCKSFCDFRNLPRFGDISCDNKTHKAKMNWYTTMFNYMLTRCLTSGFSALNPPLVLQ
jgi:hypothetical protein